MKWHFSCALLFFLGAASVVADDDLKLEQGFARLDNGKDLDGWTGRGAGGRVAGNMDGWSVVKGAIHMNPNQVKGGWEIYSKTTHSKNCIIRLEFRATKGARSGVFVWGRHLPVGDYPAVGPKEYAAPAKPAWEWNSLEFDITDGAAVVKLNGKVIEKAWRIDEYTLQYSLGPSRGNPKLGIGLQKAFRGGFDFRRIRIKEKG